MTTATGRTYTVTLGEKTYTIALHETPSGELSATIDGQKLPVSAAPLGPFAYSMMLGHESLEVGVAPGENGWVATHLNLAHDIEVAEENLARFRKAAAKTATGKDVLKAPMPGLVVGIKAAPGEKVEAGAPVIVLEAMKMQNELASKHGGTVEAIKVQVGDKVDKGQVLAIITA